MILRTSSLSVLPSLVQSSQTCSSVSHVRAFAQVVPQPETWLSCLPGSSHSSSSRAQSQACITLWAPSRQSWAHSGTKGAPLGLGGQVIATCLVSPVIALGLFSGWTVGSSRAGIGSPDPPATGTSWCLVNVYRWMKNGLQSPLLFLLSCGLTVMQGSLRGARENDRKLEGEETL